MVATPVSFINTSKLLIRLGNGGSPEQFIHPCMINTSRGIAFTSSMTESVIPFCPPDEDLPGFIDREGDSLSASVSGAGVFDSESLAIFNTWFFNQTSKNIHVEVNAGMVNGGGYYYFSALLQSFDITGPGRREKVNFTCTIVSDGAIAFANQSAAA